MSFEDVMGSVTRWTVAVEAFAALGAELTLKQSDTAVAPEIVAALGAVSQAAGLGDLGDLAPPQQMMVAAMVRMYLAQAIDLLDNPGRAPGWTFTDPVILDGWGRGSMMVPPLMAGVPELREVHSFLDVGTGVGLLAVSAAGVWPTATIVGIDSWDASLERARANVTQAGLDERITIRKQDLLELDDVDAYDSAWVPTFFVAEPVIEKALPRLLEAVRPGGWIAVGLYATPPDPLAAATASLRTIRGGGTDMKAERAIELLEQAGCQSAHAAPRPDPVPLQLVVGQRSAG